MDVFRVLEEGLGLPGRFAQEFEERESFWRRIIPTGGPGGGVHGNAVFTGLPIENYREHRLPTGAPLHWDGGTVVPELFEPRVGSRVAQVFDIPLAGRKVAFLNTHLENWRCGWGLRRKQLEAALSLVDARETVLGGDLNCLGGVIATAVGSAPVSREVRLLRSFLAEKGLLDPWNDTDYTNFNYLTRSKLDWLCVSQGLRVVEKENIRTGISDHNCLAVRIEPNW